MTDPLDDLLARLDAKANLKPTTTPGEDLMAYLGHPVPPAPPAENDWLNDALRAHAQDQRVDYDRLLGPDNTNH